MGIFDSIFKKRVPAMSGNVNRVEEDAAGNIWYIRSMYGNMQRWKVNYDMQNLNDKRDALSACSPFYSVVDKVGSMMSRGVPYVVDKNGNERRSFNALRDRLLNPNPLQPFPVFIKQIEMCLKVFGYCPLSIVRGYDGAEVKALWVIPPELFHMESTGSLIREFEESGVVLRRYVEWPSGNIDLEDYECVVIHSGGMRANGYGSEIRFKTATDSLSAPVSNWIAAMSASHTLLVNGGPKGIVYSEFVDETGYTAMSKEHEKALKDDFKRKYGLVNKEYPILVSPQKLGWIPLDFNADQLKLKEEDERCTSKICSALGINQNLFSDAKYDNQESAKKAAYQDVVIPDSLLIAGFLTKALCPEGAFVKIDFSNVECLQESRDSEASTLVKAADAMQRLLAEGLITKEEARLEVSRYIDIDPDNPKGELGDGQGSVNNQQGKEEEDEE